MYIEIGENLSIRYQDIIGIFDLDSTTVKKKARDFLYRRQKEKKVVSVSNQIPRTFIVCNNEKVILTSVKSSTILQKIQKKSKVGGSIIERKKRGL